MNSENSAGIVKTQFFTFAEKEKDYLELDSGRRFGPVTVAYETYGNLNAGKNNAILVCHALSGDAHAAGFMVRPAINQAGGIMLSVRAGCSILTNILWFVQMFWAGVWGRPGPNLKTRQQASLME